MKTKRVYSRILVVMLAFAMTLSTMGDFSMFAAYATDEENQTEQAEEAVTAEEAVNTAEPAPSEIENGGGGRQ